MEAIKDPAADVAARFLADLRTNTTRSTDQRADPAWQVMALLAFDLFGSAAGEAVVMASGLAARTPAEVAADRAQIKAEIAVLCGGARSPT
jgi:hypothetical protein